MTSTPPLSPNTTNLFASEPLKSTFNLIEIIEDGATRETVVSHYDNLPPAIQITIKRSMEIVSHGSVSMLKAEEIIHPSSQLSQEADGQIEKINHLFHLAIGYSIENALLPQMKGVDELKEIKRQIDHQHNRFAIRDAYENLSSWAECVLAKEMWEELMYDEDSPQEETIESLRRWAKRRIQKEIFSQEYLLTAENSLFCSAVETLIERYKVEWRLDNQASSSNASLQGSSSQVIAD